MKAFRGVAFGVLLAGILLIPGLSAPHAVGQSPNPTVGDQPYNLQYGPYWGVRHGQSISAKLAKDYVKAAKEEEKKEIKKKMSESLIKEFDQLAQKQQTELDDLEKQVANLKAILKKRKDSKETIVERRLEQLINEAEGLGWGSPKESVSPSYQGATPVETPK